MEEPFLYKESEPIKFALKDLYSVVKEIEAQGGKDELLQEASKGNHEVLIPSETINFIKKFMFHKGYHKRSEPAKLFIMSATCPKRPDPPLQH